MMSWNTKYYYNFKSINNDGFRVEILTTEPVTPVEITGASPPLELEYPVASKLETIRSSGATLNIISESMFQYFDLHTDSMQNYKVVIYKNGVEYWSGWLDSELYSEKLSDYDRYPVSFTASDFNILERLKYINGEDKYTDIPSLFEVLNRCINQLGLSKTLHIASSTTSTEFELSDQETILNKVFIQSANFYDEKGEAMSLKDVIESILKPFGLIMVQIKNEFYVYDINSLINNSVFKKYVNGSYISSLKLSLNSIDLQGVFSSEDSVLEFDTLYNNIELTSSLYANDSLFEKEVEKNNLEDLISTTPVSGFNGYDGTKYIYKKCTDFNDYTGEYFLYTTKGSNDTLVGVKLPYAYDKSGITYNEPSTGIEFKPTEYIINTEGVSKLNIKAQIYINTKTNPLDIYIDGINEASGVKYNKENSQCAELSCDLFLLDTRGNIISYLDNTSAQSVVWKTDVLNKTKHTFRMNFAASATPLSSADSTCLDSEMTNSNIISKYEWNTTAGSSYTNDNYQKGVDINIAGGCYLKLVIYSCLISNPKAGQSAYWIDKDKILKEILLQSVTFEIFDKYGDRLETSDIVYNSYINKNVKSDYDSVELKVCTANKNNIKVGKANLLYNTDNKYNLATSFNRSGQVNNLEQLLIRTIHSNYASKTRKIEADIQTTDNIYLNPVTYNSILPNNVFYLSGVIIDFANNTQRITLNQVSIDNIDLSSIELYDEDGKLIKTVKSMETVRTKKARTGNLLDSMTGYVTTSSSGFSSNNLSIIDGGTF